MSPIYEKCFRVHVYETNPNGMLSPLSLLNYLQDVAADHAEQMGYGYNDLKEHNSFWVMSRLYIKMNVWPRRNDDILLKTWPNGTENLFAFRNFEICFINGHLIGMATSSWLILDSTTKKIQRPVSFFEDHIIPSKKIFDLRNPSKLLHSVEQGEMNHCLRIKPGDLDINLHTNNAVYIRWITDSYNPEFHRNHNPVSIEINYLAESKYNEKVEIRASPETEDCYNHSIVRLEDKKELCRAKLTWTPIVIEDFKTITDDPTQN